MSEEKEYISLDDVEIINRDEYKDNIRDFISEDDDIAKSLIDKMNVSFNKIKQLLLGSSEFVGIVKKIIPKEELKVVLTNSQKVKLANGSLKLMTKRNGDLIASLVNPKTNKIVTNIPLKKVNVSQLITSEIMNYSNQMQLAEIAEQIKKISLRVDEVLSGQEYDRLATAYSNYQKLLQTLKIKDSNLKTLSLLQIAHSAEDSRNLLMLSQNTRLNFIKKQPESFLGKVITGDKQEVIDNRLEDIRNNIKAVSMSSLIEAMSYQELGEYESAKASLDYYSDYINKTYLEDKYLIKRLDLNDSHNYWSKYLKEINDKIRALPNIKLDKIKGDKKNNEKM